MLALRAIGVDNNEIVNSGDGLKQIWFSRIRDKRIEAIKNWLELSSV